MAERRESRAIAAELHNAALAVIEVGRQVLHATRPDWETLTVATDAQVVALVGLADELRARAEELRERMAAAAPGGDHAG